MKISNKALGVISITGSVMLLIAIITMLGIALIFTQSQGTNFLVLVPAFVVVIPQLLLCVFGVYSGVRLIKNLPYKTNNTLGSVIIFVGVLYIGWEILSFVLDIITGKFSGILSPIVGISIAGILLPVGISMRRS